MSYSYDNVKLANRASWIFNKVSSIPNAKLDWTTKGVVIGISQQYVERGIPHSQMMKLWYQGIQDYNGLSSDSIGKSVAKLKKARAAIAEQRAERKSDGSTARPMWFCFTPEFLTDPAQLFIDAIESNHGGSRVKRHKGCGGEIVNLCTACGETHIPESETYYENEPEEMPGELASNDEPERLESAIRAEREHKALLARGDFAQRVEAKREARREQSELEELAAESMRGMHHVF